MDYSCNVKFMKVPIVGSEEFLREWAEEKLAFIRRVFDGLRGLSCRHVALYILRGAGDVCRVVYYLRTMPGEMLSFFAEGFDYELRCVLEDIVGLRLNDVQWDQATLGVKVGGLGISTAASLGDAPYIASRGQTFDDCKAIDGGHVWDDGAIRFAEDESVIGEWLFGAIMRYDLQVPQGSHLAGCGPAEVGKQRLLVGKAEKIRFDALRDNAEQWDKAWLLSLAAPHAGAWLDAPPNRASDFLLSNAEVRSCVGRRLGVQLCEEAPCPFCWGVMHR